MDVNLVVPRSAGQASGIGRYTESLRQALEECGVSIQIAPFRYLPGANRRPVLRAMPIGVHGATGGIYHLPQIMGASMLLGHRVRPSVVTVHDLGALYCPEDRAQGDAIGRALLRLSLAGMRRADHIVAVSEFTRGHLLDAGYPPERVTTIHEGVDLDRFRPQENAAEVMRADLGISLPPDRPLLLYLGNELPRKNLGRFVDALGRLKKAGRSFHWVKAGASNSGVGREDLLRRIGEHGLTGDVTIIDHVADEHLPHLYSAATVYVQPSVWEGFGLPVLEAMACGTPVVASDAAALPEVCGDAALLVNARNAEELAAGIVIALDDASTRDRLREAGLRRAFSFTWEETANRTRAIYDHIDLATG